MISKNYEAVTFKGTKKGLLIVLDGQYSLEELLFATRTKLQESAKFFEQGYVKLQIKNRQPGLDELNKLSKLFSEETNLELTEIISEDGEMLVSFMSDAPKELGKKEVEDYRINQSIVIRKTIRSGQRVEFPGTIVVLGNVNPGAELIAKGDIIVFGELKGVCHAGSEGDVEASILAVRLMAKQLRIASLISRAPDDNEELIPEKPERAHVSGNQILVETIDLGNMQLDKL